MWEKRPTCFKQRKVEVVRDFPKALLENKTCSNVDSSFKSLPPMDKKSAHNIGLDKSTVILDYTTYAGQLHIEGVSGPLSKHQLSVDRYTLKFDSNVNLSLKKYLLNNFPLDYIILSIDVVFPETRMGGRR